MADVRHGGTRVTLSPRLRRDYDSDGLAKRMDSLPLATAPLLTAIVLMTICSEYRKISARGAQWHPSLFKVMALLIPHIIEITIRFLALGVVHCGINALQFYTVCHRVAKTFGLARAPVCQGHVAFFIGPKGCVASNEIVESHVVTKPQPMRFEHASRGAVPENAPVPEDCHLPARTSSPGGYVTRCAGV